MKLFIGSQLLKLNRRILFIVYTGLLIKYKKAPKQLLVKSIYLPLGHEKEDLEDLIGDIWSLEQDIKFT
jgi:hypothetical protein